MTDHAEDTADDVRAACAGAAAAVGALDDLGSHGRRDLLLAMADAVEASAADLAVTADRETGLGHDRLSGEAARTARQFRLMAEVLSEGSLLDIAIDRRLPAGQPGGPRPELRRMSTSVGVVAVYAASNFPLAFGVAGTDTAAALAAGCPVVAKAHPYQPATARLAGQILRRAARECGLSADVVRVVHGLDAGRVLIADPDVAAGAFTGSVAGGRALWDLACARPDPIPFFGELGSINPVIVTPGAARDRGTPLGAELAASAMASGGQFCTHPGPILVPAGPGGEQIIAAIAATVTNQPAATLLGDRLATDFADATGRLQMVPGARLLAAGAPAGPDTPLAVQAQAWQLPARRAIDRPDASLHEYFGPMALVVTYDTTDEVVELLEAVRGCLTVSVHAADDEHALAGWLLRLAARRGGRVLGGGVPTGVAVGWAQHHGGPWPASTHSAHTSVGAASIRRFLRPVVYQDVPHHLLPAELHDHNPLGLVRRIDARLSTDAFA